VRISVVIPNFNGLEGLKILLPKLFKGNFSGIYIVDDASTDQSIAYANAFSEVKIIGGDKNLGPAGNRNRILHEKNLGELLWFVDADMDLVTINIEHVAEKLFTNPLIALIGGFILNRNGRPMYWNYGYEKHPLRDRIAEFYGKLGNKYKKNKKVMDLIRRNAIDYFYGLEIDAENHQERVVEWVAEGNFLVRTDVFKRIGGFDENMRYHEAHDLCKRIRELGFIVKFSPEIVTRHLEIDCRQGGKARDWRNGEKYFYKKHWGTPHDAFKNFFRLWK
jgi:GT2 family glycosyltransferase